MTDYLPLNKIKASGLTWFKRKQDAKNVYEIHSYNRSDKTYTCIDTEDISRCIFIKANKPVFINFEY